MKDVLDDLAEALAAGPVDDVLALLGVAGSAPAPVAAGPVDDVPAPPVAAMPARRDDRVPHVTLPMPLVRQQLAHRAQETAGLGLDLERLAWPDEWFDANDIEAGQACGALWGEVLRLCLVDISAVAGGIRRAELSLSGYATTQARDSWLRSRDFQEVAALAGLDGHAVLERLTPILADPARAAAFYWMLVGQGRRVKVVEGHDDSES